MKCDELIRWQDKDLTEADKVIAELNRQIKFLKTTHDSCGNCNSCADGMGKVFDENLNKLKEQIRHQKYKRCLAMALLSLEKIESYRVEYEEWCLKRYKWCLKWYKRWMELAEKFKDGK